METGSVRERKGGAREGVVRAFMVCGFFTLAFHAFWNHSIIFRDSFILYTPVKFMIGEAWRNLRFQEWNPAIMLGMPLIGDPLAGWYYPLNILYATLPFRAAHNFFILVHYPLAALFMDMFLRGRGLNRTAAMAGGIVFALSGYMTCQHANMNYLIGPAWAPLAFYLMDRARDNGVKWAAGAGALIAMQVIAGEPQSAVVTGVLLAAFSMGELREKKQRALVPVIVAGVSAVVLSAAQWVPTAELFAHSVRDQGISLYRATMLSFHPGRMLELAWPTPFGTFWPANNYHADFAVQDDFVKIPWSVSNYLGLPALLLAAAGLALKRKKFTIAVAASALFFLLLSFGRHFPLYALLYRVIPGFSLFRFPEKYLAWFTMGAAILAAIGLDEIMSRFPARARFIGLGILAVLAADLYLHNVRLMPSGPADLYSFTPPADAVIRADRPTAPGLYRIHRLDMEFNDRNPALKDYPPLERMCIFERATLRPNLHAMLAYHEFAGYNAAMIGTGIDFILGRTDVPYRLYNVHYLISSFGKDAALPGRKIFEDKKQDFAIHRLDDSLPRAYWVPSARRANDDDEAMRLVKEIDPGKEAVITTGEEISGQNPGLPLVPAQVVSYGDDRVELAIDAPAPGWLILSDRFFPGWEASLDDGPAKIYQANVMVRAVKVSAGRHTAVFSYRPFPLRAGMIVSAIGWMAFLGWMLKGRSNFYLS